MDRKKLSCFYYKLIDIDDYIYNLLESKMKIIIYNGIGAQTLLIVLFAISLSHSSLKDLEINTQNRRIIFNDSTIEEAYQKDYINDSNYFYIAFKTNPSPDIKKLFIENGIYILQFAGRGTGDGLAYAVKINKDVQIAINIMKESGILIGIVETDPLDKISSDIIDSVEFKKVNTYDSTNATILANIYWYEDVNEQKTRELLSQYGIDKINSFEPVTHVFEVRSSREHLINIAELQEISAVYAINLGVIPEVITPKRIIYSKALKTINCFDLFGRKSVYTVNDKACGIFIYVQEHKNTLKLLNYK